MIDQRVHEIYGYIYLIKNKINNKLYFGQTVQTFDERYHKDLEKNTNNMHLKNSIKKYRIENFEIIDIFDIAYTKEELNKLEYMYIRIYNTTNPKYGYNKKDGGNGGRLTEEIKNKIKGHRGAWRGKHLSNEHKAKIKESCKECIINQMVKVICLNTTEVFNSVTEAGKKYKVRESAISACCKNNRRSAGYLENGTKLTWSFLEEYATSTTEEILRKISKVNEPKPANRSKKVICLTTNKGFKSITEASQEYAKYNAHLSGIGHVCNGNRKTAGKLPDGTPLKWKYI